MYRAKCSFIFRFILLVIALVCVLELSLRLSSYPASYTDLFKFDQELGYRLAPGEHSFFTGDREYSVLINDQGILDHAGKGKTQVIILGDGVVSGLELPPDDRLGSLVTKNTGYNTVNLSVPGYGTVQQLIALRLWLQKNEAPKHVYIIYNFSNDYYDNVQAWEGVRVPSIMGDKAGTKIVLPENPSFIGKIVRYIVWNSRIYSFYSQATLSRESNQKFPLQQRWLFSHEPPHESKLGDEATFLSSFEIGRLAKQYGFTLTWIGWRDLPLEQMEGLSGDMATNRIMTLIGENGIWEKIPQSITLENDGILKWESQWLHPQTRHASAAAIASIAQKISLTLNASKCGNCIVGSIKQ